MPEQTDLSEQPVPDTPRELPAYVTMPLLDRVRAGAVDQEYADRAARRVRGGKSARARGPWRFSATVVALLLFGLLVATAFVQNVRTTDQDASSRASLLSRIDAERQSIADSQERLGTLQTEVAQLNRESQLLSAELARSQEREERLGLSSGFVAVTGPGVRVDVDDSPSGDSLEAVRDEDLALLVDGLWGAGAEAIAINNKRLTVLSSIRNTGTAINVNSRPLSPPYTVLAIGDPDTLQSNLLASERGNSWIGMADQLGFIWSMENAESLTLPAARMQEPSYAVRGLDGRPDKEALP